MNSRPLRCPIAGCVRIRTANQLTCRDHWWKIPSLLRDQVWRTWRKRLANPSEANVDAHELAKTAALSFLSNPTTATQGSEA